jgi:hypothetical protein
MTYFQTFKDINNYLTKTQQMDISAIIWPKYYVHYLPQSSPKRIYLRIEELSGGLFGTRIGAKYRPIGSIDLEINEKSKSAIINWWMVNDDLHDKWTPGLYAPILSHTDAKKMRDIIFDYVDYNAKKYNCNKIERDVHNSLNEYNHSLKDYGFILTEKKADDNKFWLKTFKSLDI